MTTKRHPRTLNEAFGPYCDSRIQEQEDLADWDGVLIVVVIMCLGIAAVLLWSML